MKEILLSNSEKTVWVDDEDYDWIRQLCSWHLDSKSRYSLGWIKNTQGKLYYVAMHRVIYKKHFGLEPKQQIDHIDRNGLNNQKSNLRLCNHSQNRGNCEKSKTKHFSSQYKGVCWLKREQKWSAHIKINQKHLSLGHWETERQAAIAYDLISAKHYGEFFYPNIFDATENEIKEILSKNLKNIKLNHENPNIRN